MAEWAELAAGRRQSCPHEMRSFGAPPKEEIAKESRSMTSKARSNQDYQFFLCFWVSFACEKMAVNRNAQHDHISLTEHAPSPHYCSWWLRISLVSVVHCDVPHVMGSFWLLISPSPMSHAPDLLMSFSMCGSRVKPAVAVVQQAVLQAVAPVHPGFAALNLSKATQMWKITLRQTPETIR